MKLLIIIVLYSQSYFDLKWFRYFGGVDDEKGYAVCEDKYGNYVIAGYTRSFAQDFTDFYVIKVDSTGDSLIARTFSRGDEEKAYGIAYDTAGYFIVVGYSQNPNDPADRDFWIIKLDENFNIIWDTIYGGSEYDIAYDVKIDRDGNYVVVGKTKSYAFGSYYDAWVLKLNPSDGSLLGSWNFGLTDEDVCYSLDVDYNNNYILAGYTWSYSLSQDAWILKISSDGVKLWEKYFGGDDQDEVNSVCVDKEGYYIAFGTYWDPVTVNPDFYLLKLEPQTGDTVFAKRYGGDEDNIGMGIAVDNEGKYLTCGYNSTGPGYTDGKSLRIEPLTGDTIKTLNVVGSGIDYLYDVFIDKKGHFVYVGASNSGGSGLYDIFVIKLQGIKVSIREEIISSSYIPSNGKIKSIYDISGRIKKISYIKTGVYFIKERKGTRKILILR